MAEPPTDEDLVLICSGAPESADTLLPGFDDPCPNCGGELHFGYGLMGGGCGAYALCDACDFFAKKQDNDG